MVGFPLQTSGICVILLKYFIFYIFNDQFTILTLEKNKISFKTDLYILQIEFI